MSSSGSSTSNGHRPDKTVITAANPRPRPAGPFGCRHSNKNEVYLPVPATSATAAPGYDSTLCGTSATAKAAGCIAVFSTTPNNDHPNPCNGRMGRTINPR